jgi:hypothetical protein
MIKVLLETKCGCSKVIELPHLKEGVDVLIPGFPSHYRTFDMRIEKKDGMPHYVESKTERVKSWEEIADNTKEMLSRLPPGTIVDCDDPQHITKEEIKTALAKNRERMRSGRARNRAAGRSGRV